MVESNQKMHDSIMVDGCLSNYNLREAHNEYKLKLGEVQSLCWKTDNHGPYFMQHDEREALRVDMEGTKFVTRDTNEMICDIIQSENENLQQYTNRQQLGGMKI